MHERWKYSMFTGLPEHRVLSVGAQFSIGDILRYARRRGAKYVCMHRREDGFLMERIYKASHEVKRGTWYRKTLDVRYFD